MFSSSRSSLRSENVRVRGSSFGSGSSVAEVANFATLLQRSSILVGDTSSWLISGQLTWMFAGELGDGGGMGFDCSAVFGVHCCLASSSSWGEASGILDFVVGMGGVVEDSFSILNAASSSGEE